MIDYDYWNALSAQERVIHWNATGELLKAPGTIELGSISSFILREHFHDTQNNFCGSCEEPQPSVMCWSYSDDDDLDDHKNPTLSKVVENLKVEDSICSWCVEEEVTRRICVHCKKPGWHLRNPCLEGFEHQFEQTTDYDEVVA
tara:strand:+ start:270 stop:701 length:432 start_codon:yes stop_codon:yes gene_type:complete